MPRIKTRRVSKREVAFVLRRALPGMAPTGPTGDYRTDVAIQMAAHLMETYVLFEKVKSNAECKGS
jgi:hypothetical protein